VRAYQPAIPRQVLRPVIRLYWYAI